MRAGVYPERPAWYEDRNEVVTLARWLLSTAEIRGVDELLHLFEKPWLWSDEREYMVAWQGRVTAE